MPRTHIKYTAKAVAFVIFLIVTFDFESAAGWTQTRQPTAVVNVASRSSGTALSSHLGVPGQRSIPNEHSALSRRQALLTGGASIASMLSLPGISRAETEYSLEAVASSSAAATTSLLSDYNPMNYKTLPSLGRSIFPFPFIPPFNNRATYRYYLGRDAYALEQLLAFANVTATIRTNVIKMDDGGLWVCNPLYPTEEYCALLDELGPVKHVVLASNALEHKAAMKQFCAYLFHLDGPFGECGIVTDDMDEEQVAALVKQATKTMKYRVDGIFPVKTQSASTNPKPKSMYPPWSDTFDIATLCVELPGNAGPVSEVAFVHKPTNTLAVIDAVICVPEVSATAGDTTCSSPTFPLQPIFSTYDKFDEATINDPTFWARTVLQAVFLPLRAETSDSGKEVYPGFEALTNRLVRAPILRSFDDARAPESIRQWVDEIASLQKFDRIISGHFASPINAGPKLFTKAFAYLDENASVDELASALPPIACRDWSTLNSLNDLIDENKLGAPVVYDFRRGCVE